MLDIFEAFESVLDTASRLSTSAKHYIENDWSSMVAKGIRKEKLVNESCRLREDLAGLGKMLFSLLNQLQSSKRDSMNYLTGIQPQGRGDFFGAPAAAPVFSFSEDDSGREQDSPVLVHIAMDTILKPKYGDKELGKFFDEDPATYPFIHTITLEDSVAAEQMLQIANESIDDLTKTCADFGNYIRSNLTIDDLLA